MCHNTQYIIPCCIWGCIVASQSCEPMSIAQIVFNGLAKLGTGACIKRRLFDKK